MITVKLYGLMRIESGIRELQLECSDTKELYKLLQENGLDKQTLKGCCVLVNGETASARSRFAHGDVIQILPPVAGG